MTEQEALVTVFTNGFWLAAFVATLTFLYNIAALLKGRDQEEEFNDDCTFSYNETTETKEKV